jgi:putative membrane protein
MILAQSAAAQTAAPEDNTQNFITLAAQAGLAEIELAKLARASTSSDAVRVFAARIIADHQRANEELAAIARSKGLTVPAELDATPASAVQALRGKSGSRFDREYVRRTTIDNEKAVTLFRSVFNSDGTAADADVTGFARRTLPVLREHKRLAEDLYAAR